MWIVVVTVTVPTPMTMGEPFLPVVVTRAMVSTVVGVPVVRVVVVVSGVVVVPVPLIVCLCSRCKDRSTYKKCQ